MLNNMKELPDFDKRLPHQVLALLASRIKGLDSADYLDFLSQGESPSALLDNPQRINFSAALKSTASRLGAVNAVLAQIRGWKNRGIHAVGVSESLYPALLKQIYKPPLILFVRGQLSNLLSAPEMFSVVGSRSADLSGCEIARQFGFSLAASGVCVVSGLALGVDAAAHRGAVESAAAFPTIAVLGNGLRGIYPSANERLAQKILDRGGLLISQFEPEEKPFPVNFLNRNRIIAGLSQGVLIVQAAKRSGALATARYALDEGREVFVAPGAIGDARYEGSNNLLKQGACLVTSVEDIFEALPQLKTAKHAANGSAAGQTAPRAESPLQADILRLLKGGSAMHYDALARSLGGPSELAAGLLDLELSGAIMRLPGNQIALAPKL